MQAFIRIYARAARCTEHARAERAGAACSADGLEDAHLLRCRCQLSPTTQLPQLQKAQQDQYIMLRSARVLARLQEGTPASSHPEEGAQHQISNLISGREASKDLVGCCQKLQRPSGAMRKQAVCSCMCPACMTGQWYRGNEQKKSFCQTNNSCRRRSDVDLHLSHACVTVQAGIRQDLRKEGPHDRTRCTFGDACAH